MRDLSEVDVHWAGSYVGLDPTLTGDAVDRVVSRGTEAVPDLLAALDDPQTFVPAHVLLTWISRVRYETSPTWNGLAVELPADGEARVDAEQRVELAQRWRRWFSAEPRPDQLPA